MAETPTILGGLLALNLKMLLFWCIAIIQIIIGCSLSWASGGISCETASDCNRIALMPVGTKQQCSSSWSGDGKQCKPTDQFWVLAFAIWVAPALLMVLWIALSMRSRERKIWSGMELQRVQTRQMLPHHERWHLDKALYDAAHGDESIDEIIRLQNEGASADAFADTSSRDVMKCAGTVLWLAWGFPFYVTGVGLFTNFYGSDQAIFGALVVCWFLICSLTGVYLQTDDGNLDCLHREIWGNRSGSVRHMITQRSAQLKCAECKAVLAEKWRFCPQCGIDNKNTRAPKLEGVFCTNCGRSNHGEVVSEGRPEVIDVLPSAPQQSTEGNDGSVTHNLRDLVKMHKEGQLTESEFSAAKANLLKLQGS